ncbi:NAD-dependent succinate-semialdehyde dehydrogenase [Pseudonocardia sp. RS11V-5]|uniref:NAD-dependent succinate-semialdehyde dehydrogenase n=1 Tax=Pseudonocardia terrae TaxID=2905831 RepID=UPI001E3AA733|nr:NAD-dependent succinate-semialdehyde dehydrogenase [Pseudonocardia terrae]MCE3551403.1 NAD-dependent succinate-semialdehyde dehydrogenase [Pseudonocardia terrae]
MTTIDAPAPDRLPTDVPTRLFIGGRWIAGSDGATMPVEDPATGQVLCHVADASPADGVAALDAARAAGPAWAAAPARERSRVLRRAHDLVVSRTEELALVMTREMGKPLAEARGEVAYAAGFLEWFAEEAVRIGGEYGRTPNGAARTVVTRRPVGTCLLVTPWNFPLAMAARKIAPALAAGCTVVLKPAPQTPLSSLLLAEILAEAGLPAGAVNVVPTSRAGEVVAPLLRSGHVRKLSFTGSTAVGRLLLAQASDAVVRTSMELGGNAPFLVFDDADLDVAVDGAVQAKMRNMGEACVAANRFFVHRSVATEFAERLGARMGSLVVGPGTSPTTQVGPLIDAGSRAKVAGLVDDAVARGAEVVCGAAIPSGSGYFYPPTVLAGVAPDSALVSEEIFGPVAAIQVFDTDDDVVALANATVWGLAGYVFTRDLDRALSVAEALDVGMVGLNGGAVSNPAAPFGGVKQSGFGREGGRQGIEEYLDVKMIMIPVRDRDRR